MVRASEIQNRFRKSSRRDARHGRCGIRIPTRDRDGDVNGVDLRDLCPDDFDLLNS